MKRTAKQLLCGLFAILMVSSLLHTSAFVRSSMYLDGYAAAVTPQSGGKIAVTVDVSGVGKQAVIGSNLIYIYESKDGSYFYKVKTYKAEDYPEMLSSGTYYYDTPVKYSGKPGYYYKASVYCYAGDGTNGDERNYTTSAKRAIA